MRIAACDDDALLLGRLKDLINSYNNKDGVSVTADFFNSGIDLLASLEKNSYDLLILDILMPGFSGMDTAKEIRQHDLNINIVFLTSSPEFAVESYRVHAYDYLIKPVQKDQLYEILDRLSALERPNEEVIIIESGRAKFALPFAQTEYIDVFNRTLIFHMADGSTHEVTGRLYDYEDKFTSRREFTKIHRSYIVNMKYIKSLDARNCVMLSGNELPISRSNSKNLGDIYMDYIMSASKG